MVGEGGAVETDGAGTPMATRSSILVSDRNPGMTDPATTGSGRATRRSSAPTPTTTSATAR
ncbi:agmatine deiminase family protein [Streptomyces sp. BE20]|uniref:agmatine deiminase family protein n=1 Tax=Streptomyces sp. BE20 TaxID=3002525 RepID=UPI002E78BC86|nr:agmatine deiminase family protein [Streptomyces sp. BE20]MEE1824070.1 agmatine deiminase family protein [Streptomyces sp. BE20]